jgi:hypothetical protein
MSVKDFLEQIRMLIDYIERLEIKLKLAEAHIKRNINLFSADELECMALDGLIKYQDIPENKRTEFVNAQLLMLGKHVRRDE